MSKIGLIADLHFGIKKANNLFLQSQSNFIKDEFIPYLKENNINKIKILGDVFDNRTHINIKVKNKVYDLFKYDLKDFDIDILLGNHDIFYNTTTDIHSLKWLKEFKNVRVIEDITPDLKENLLYVPWQINEKHFIDYLKDEKNHPLPKICLGHFNISGFYMNKFKLNEEGSISDIFFDNFKLTFSGHFHTIGRKEKNGSEIIYIGAPYHLTRHDINEEKAFIILDTETYKYDFVHNKNSIRFVVINYPEKPIKKLITGNIIDINVIYDNNYDEDKVQKYIKEVEEMKPILPPNIKIINNFDLPNINDYQIKSSYELMKEYVLNLEIQNKDEIYQTMERLYEECKSEI